jgi:hypothetical protein
VRVEATDGALRPGRAGFELLDTGRFTVGLAEGMEPPETLEIKERLWPLRGIRVYWDGRRWGARGADAGG